MASKDEEAAEAALKAAKREGAAEERAKAAAKEASFGTRTLRRAVAVRDRAIAEIRSRPNLPHVVVAGGSAVGGSFGGYWVNQYLRRKTAEWKWVNDEGGRSWASILLADAAPVAAGVGMIFLGAFVVRHATLSAALVGAGMGVAGGSILSTALGPDSGNSGNA